jgi:hypothetical protein
MPVPPALFGTPVTIDELWSNILADLGHAGRPTTLGQIMKDLDSALFAGNLGVYGSASDGVVTFIATGSTTVAGATLSSGVYTMTRDVYLGGGTAINTGVTIKTAGFRIFCQGTLINNGTIDSSGNASVANAAGAALSYSGTVSNTTVGAAGAAGSTTTGSAGSSSATNSIGGAGGAGGSNVSGPNAGAAGGTVTAPLGTVQGPYTVQLAVLARVLGTTAYALLQGGAGGGGGGGDGTNLSGGGGGGGGIVVVVAQTITGTGVIQANGGAGGAANATGTPSGGGGGGGGAVIVVSRSIVSQAVNGTSTATLSGQTIQALGGAAGAAGAGGGVVGTVGAAGSVILLAA